MNGNPFLKMLSLSSSSLCEDRLTIVLLCKKGRAVFKNLYHFLEVILTLLPFKQYYLDWNSVESWL